MMLLLFSCQFISSEMRIDFRCAKFFVEQCSKDVQHDKEDNVILHRGHLRMSRKG